METNQNLDGLNPLRRNILTAGRITNNYRAAPANFLSEKNPRNYARIPRKVQPQKVTEPRPNTIPESRVEARLESAQPISTLSHTEMIISTRDPLEELPPDLKYSEWFYYNIRSLKSRSTSTQRDSAQLVEPYLHKPVNETIDPQMNELLTQGMSSDLIPPIQQISCYKISIDRTELDDSPEQDSMVPGTSNGVSGSSESPNVKKKRVPKNKKKDPCQLLLSVQPQIAIIDRRPMLKRLALKERKSPPPDSISASLISPEEDCDDDSDIVENIEIDCD